MAELAFLLKSGERGSSSSSSSPSSVALPLPSPSSSFSACSPSATAPAATATAGAAASYSSSYPSSYSYFSSYAPLASPAARTTTTTTKTKTKIKTEIELKGPSGRRFAVLAASAGLCLLVAGALFGRAQPQATRIDVRESLSELDELYCTRETTGFCGVFGFCAPWKGSDTCGSGKCLCPAGTCNSPAGVCKPQATSNRASIQPVSGKCVKDTGSLCKLDGAFLMSALSLGSSGSGSCSFWHGPALCAGTKCYCEEGSCSDEFGFCYKRMGMVRAEVVPINTRQPWFPGPKVTTALCLSGGGSRALSASLGVFRALRDLNLLTNIDAISSISGGTWASSILMFAPMDLQTLLGPALGHKPEALTLQTLDAIPPPLGASVMARMDDIALGLKLDGVPLSMLWVISVAKAFLEPFDLNHLDAYLASSQEEVERIKAKNPQFRDAKFQVVQPGRAKTVIMNSAVLSPPDFQAGPNTTVNLQVSPDFTGSPFYPNDQTVSYRSLKGGSLEDVLIGGGMISTYAFGSAAPESAGQNGQMGGQDVEMQSGTRPMCLARAVGWSSAAFGAALAMLPGIGERVDPHSELWPVTSAEHPESQQAIREQIGDGADIENTGVNAALQRGASKIVSLISCDKRFDRKVDYCAAPASVDYRPLGKELVRSFANLFGVGLNTGEKSRGYHEHSQVFPTSEYLPTLCEFQKLQDAGMPLVLRRQLTTVANAWWGIEGGRSVDIVFIMISQSTQFESLLPLETRTAIEAQAGLPHWPHFLTVFQNLPDLTSYTPRQINLLAALMEWSVLENEEMIREVLG